MIHILIGTRAQLIKMVPVMCRLQQENIDYNFIFMAQHHETIYEILQQYGLKKPDYVISDTGSDIVTTKAMIIWSIKTLYHGIRFRAKVFKNDKKGIVLIHGDAPPLLLGALMAKAQGIKVASVEAGLRSFNLFKPFPEELTRVLTARLGLIYYYFCQDQAALMNVKNCPGIAILTNGNTIYDMLNMTQPKQGEKLPYTNYAIATLHRYETISDSKKMQAVMDKIIAISAKIKLLFVLHPPTRTALHKLGLFEKLDNIESIELVPRMDFITFNQYLVNAEFIISDGGSNQEESAYLGVPCLLFREESERSEGIGKNVVLSKFDDQIIEGFIDNYQHYRIKTELEGKSPTQIIIENIKSYA